MRLDWIERMERELEEGRWCALATVIEVEGTKLSRQGEKLLLLADGSFRGDLGCPELALRLATAFQASRGVPQHYDVRLQLEEPGSGWIRAAVEVHEPEPEILIIGGGHVGKCVAQMAEFVGLPFAVADDREAFASEERFPRARRRHAGALAELLPALATHEHSYVVICTRGHAFDELAVGAMLRKPHAYLGLLGSRRKAAEIFKNLRTAGLSPEEMERVRTPVGLQIGAETPEEIAVSIIAEILSLARTKERFKVVRVEG